MFDDPEVTIVAFDVNEVLTMNVNRNPRAGVGSVVTNPPAALIKNVLPFSDAVTVLVAVTISALNLLCGVVFAPYMANS
jgi:hypothetical protein